MTQLDTLRAAFDRGEALTVLTAIHKYGVYALSQRCGELYRAGYPLHTDSIKLPSGKWVARYRKDGTTIYLDTRAEI